MRVLFAAACLALFAATAMAQEAVATRTLRPGDIVAKSDLRGTDGETGAGLAALVGLEVRRAVYVGRPVSRDALGPPTLVARNALVAMRFASAGLGIRTEGRALESGGLGERVRVMNLASRQVVTATVAARGLVEVRR